MARLAVRRRRRARRPAAGSPKGIYARAEFYRRQKDRAYTLTAEATLLNPIAPVEFFVSNSGRLVTVDNWHNRGYGKVVAVYNSSGQPVASYERRDLFNAEEIERFTHSESSIEWHTAAVYIRDDQTTLPVSRPGGGDFVFGLESGRYKYCEYQAKAYLCRTPNQPRRWLPNADVPVIK